MQRLEQHLRNIRPFDLSVCVALSLSLQFYVYYRVMGPWVTTCLLTPPLRLMPAKDRTGAFAQEAVTTCFHSPNRQLLEALLHQLLSAHIFGHQYLLKRPLLLPVFLSTTASFLITCRAWFIPVKLTAAAALIKEGETLVYQHLKEIFETYPKWAKRLWVGMQATGSGLMAAALLVAYRQLRKPLFTWIYLSYAAIQVYSLKEIVYMR